MAFILYFIVILVSAASMVFALDLANSPLPSTPNVPIGRIAHSPPSVPITRTRNDAKRTFNRAPTVGAAKMAGDTTKDAKPQPAQSAARCDVAACEGAYRSFRASDCTYQPYHGPRQVCTKSGRAVTASAPARRRRHISDEPGAGVSRSARDQHDVDIITGIVRQMTRGQRGDIAVQDSHGRIIIVHPDSARANAQYYDYRNH